MPTIQEEMSKVLNEWNKPAETIEEPMTHPITKNQFGVTNNVSRITFDYVKANPGVTAAQAGHALGKDGFKMSSVTSIMAQMVRTGSMRKERFNYYVTTDEYVPIKVWKKSDRTVGVRNPHKPKAKVEAPRQEAKPTTITVKDIVENMTMREARELYVELGKYFGA
jgi:hypothetical protein